MHIIAISSSLTTSIHVLFTFRIHKICDRRKLRLNFLTIKESPIDIFLCILGKLLFTIFDVNISNNMITKIVHYYHIFNFSIFHHFFENLFIKLFIFCHSCISVCPAYIISINECSLNCIVFIHMFETDCL